MSIIPFNKPYLSGNEIKYIQEAHLAGALAGNGTYTNKCTTWIEQKLQCKSALLTHSCTAALEMSSLILDYKPGDEIIMPSYTFVSSANAFVLRGVIPVFVDIDPITLNLSPSEIIKAITNKTKAILVVHYAGHSCFMDQIQKIANDFNLDIIEDAAQAFLSKDSNNRYLGTIGSLGCISFHETKNIISGEGGCLLINKEEHIERAQVLHEKGTNRTKFLKGTIDKYTWEDLGSSFLPGELVASFLYAQLQSAEEITQKRRKLWSDYYLKLSAYDLGDVKLPQINLGSDLDNAHIFYLLAPTHEFRDNLIYKMKLANVQTVFHYVPLHSSPGGIRFGRFIGNMENTNDIANRLIRLPLWIGLDTDLVIRPLVKIINDLNRL